MSTTLKNFQSLHVCVFDTEASFLAEIFEPVESRTFQVHFRPKYTCWKFSAYILPLIGIAIAFYIMKEDYHPTFQSGSEKETAWNHSAMNTYVRFLNDIYQQRHFPVYYKSHTFSNKPNHFIDLAIVLKERETDKKMKDHTLKKLHGEVESLKQNRVSLNISDIGKIGQRNAKHILIEGAPGAGKTTLAWHLCRLWGSGKLLQHWSVVIMIQIRHPRFRNAATLHDLIHHPKSDVRQAVVNHIEETNGKGFLLVFEGYDELNEKQISQDGIFMKLLRGDELPAVSIMVTSRGMTNERIPENFRDHPDLQHIEILGFEKKDVSEYINKSCVNKPQQLKNFYLYLRSHPFVHSAMVNPFHCAVITELYLLHWEQGNKAFAPKTLTEMYTHLVIAFISWEMSTQSSKEFSDLLKTQHLTDLPPSILQELEILGKLAADGIQQQIYIFDSVPSLHLQGFLQKVSDIYSSDEQTSYSFLHLTVQEYFAALYWSQNPSTLDIERTLKHWIEHGGWNNAANSEMIGTDNKTLSPNHWTALLYFAGLTQLAHSSTKELLPLIRSEQNVKNIQFPLCHLLFECQCTKVIPDVLTNGSHDFSTSEYENDLDHFVRGFCLAHSHPSCVWSLRIHTDKQVNMMAMGMHYVDVAPGNGGKIEQVYITIANSKLFEFHQHINDLKILELSLPPMDSPSELEFFEGMLIYFPKLQSLILHYSSRNLILNNYQTLIDVLPKFKHLKTLEIDFTHDFRRMFCSPGFDPYLNRHCFMKDLITVGNPKEMAMHTDADSLSALKTISPILPVTTIEHLHLLYFHISNPTTSILVESVRSSNCSLHTLELRYSYFRSIEAFENLLSAVTASKCLQKISFCCDTISEERSLSLANALLEMNGALREVDLHQEDSIGDTSALRFRNVVCVSRKDQVKIRLSLKYWEGLLEFWLTTEAKQDHILISTNTCLELSSS